MQMNDAARPGQVCPHMGSQPIDMSQPPGIGIRAIPDMDRLPWMVAAAQATNTSVQVARNALFEAIFQFPRHDGVPGEDRMEAAQRESDKHGGIPSAMMKAWGSE